MDLKRELVKKATLAEFKAAGIALKEGYKHFLNGFRLAADDICEEFGGFHNLTSVRDVKQVFNLIREIAAPQVGLSPKTFDRYCKIARYCIIYNVPWDISAVATREKLRWCKNRIPAFRSGTTEEKMIRAWEERVKLDRAEQEEAKKREAALLAEIGSVEPDAASLIHIPLPKPGQDEDAYWMDYLNAQVAHIQKHMDKLNGDSYVKATVRHFFADAMPIVKSAKKPAKRTLPPGAAAA